MRPRGSPDGRKRSKMPMFAISFEGDGTERRGPEASAEQMGPMSRRVNHWLALFGSTTDATRERRRSCQQSNGTKEKAGFRPAFSIAPAVETEHQPGGG